MNEEFDLNNLELMIYIVKEEAEYLSNINNPSNVIPPVSNWRVKSVVADILSELDDTDEWFDIYARGIQSIHILYLNELDDASLYKLKRGLGILDIDGFDNTCMNLGGKDSYLFLKYEGNLCDIIFTIHEMMHYINGKLDDNEKVLPIIREFPSMFYEKYALNHLYKLGYSKEEIISAYHFRIDDLNECINTVKNIISNNNIPTDDNTKNTLLECYSYILCDYLARIAMDKTKDDKTLFSMIKYITENLSKINISDIFSILQVNEKRRILK